MSSTMNEDLVERFRRSKVADRRTPGRTRVEVWIQPQKLNSRVRQYSENPTKPADAGPWLDRPEFPSAAEILDFVDGEGASSSEVLELVPNKVKGSWESKEAYLSALYELSREDTVRPLREAVCRVRKDPGENEDFHGGSLGIYQNVHVNAVVCSTRGIALRVSLSTFRAQKKIAWEQSKRLISGSLVALTPASDMFRTTAIVATVAARPLSAITQNPAEVDLFIARSEELEIDPSVAFVMVEERSSYFEANRHTMLALQKIRTESFPMAEHLVGAKPSVSAPTHIKVKPVMKMNSVFINNKHENYDAVDVLHQWPTQPQSTLDNSQIAAMRRILTKKLAIVQGPPGTGKTHVSVEALKVMLENWKQGDPPIIIACQTNHALDQLLRHIAKFCPEFVRVGGRSKDREVIKARTLYEVRNSTSSNALPGSCGPPARKKMRELEKDIAEVLAPLQPDKKSTINHRYLVTRGLLTEAQADSLEKGASKWVQAEQVNPGQAARSPMSVWLGRSLEAVNAPGQPEEFGFDLEETDLEYEQLKEIEAENFAKDDEEIDSLSGTSYPIADNFTGRKFGNMSKEKIAELLKQQNLWKIAEGVRGALYRYLQKEAKAQIRSSLRDLAKKYDEQARLRRVGNLEKDELILREQKVIGLTTTGLSKYRGLISPLQPKVVLIEEAAETLEAPIVAGCMPSLEQLILVGDHKQLRPHCQMKSHEGKPYFLNISLFERLINNSVEFDTLVKQRRMIPEIRRILYPIYKNLIQDHASVLDPANRPDVPGMGGVNSFFFTHQWLEQRDDLMSCVNPEEADMIIGFVEYLVYNGMQAEDITVLTFYNGQRKRVLNGLRRSVALVGHRFNVVTVDSYQGEENKVVILSLVRSNDKNQIGFLNIDNRVCVALSRAMCGFYMFGNGMLLYKNKTWESVIEIIAGQKKKSERPKAEPVCRLAEKFPVRCKKHNNVTEIKDASDWQSIVGGCQVPCGQKLPCGHKCELTCHPFAHDHVPCQQACVRVLSCGHKCSVLCGEVCVCKLCTKVRAITQAPNQASALSDAKEDLTPQPSSSSLQPWKSFSNEEPGRYAVAVSAPLSRRSSPRKDTLGNSLIETGNRKGVEVACPAPLSVRFTPTSTSASTGRRVKHVDKVEVSTRAMSGAFVEEEEEEWLIDL